jgi:repressor LexA
MQAIKHLRAKKNISQKELADKLNVSRSTISMWETGASQPDNENILKMAEIFNVSVDVIFGREAYPDRPESTGGKWIPVLGTIAAGVPIAAIEDIIDWEEITLEMANTGEHFALKIKGSSMEPLISESDVVIVKQQPDVDSGDVAVVIINGEDATIKKIKKMPEGVMLIPNNPAFEPRYYSNKEVEALPVQILGKVVELRRKF